MKKITLTEIAERINAHLKRFEADPKINCIPPGRSMKLHPYWHSRAYQAGNRVSIVYISFQGSTNLTREDAEMYMHWLDAGGIGAHWGALRGIKGTR